MFFNKTDRKRGFTLVELLVVIGIIAILVGILIPVAGHVRTAAHVAATQSRIQVLMAGIEQYRQTFEAYPGPLSDSTTGTGKGFLLSALNPSGGATGTENLTLALLGGWKLDSANPAPGVFDPTLVGLGPNNLNLLKTQRYQPFIDIVAGGLDKAKVAGKWVPWSDPSRTELQYQTAFKDTAIPEFVDAFPNPLPILYIRAHIGATNVVPNYPTAGNGPYQYDPKQLSYAYPFQIENLNGITNGPDPTQPDFPTLQDYFGSIADKSVPKQKDGYLLIAAGPPDRNGHRLYGEASDITNVGKMK